MAIQIQDFAGKEQFQSILCDWAIATGLEAMVQATDGKTVYFANAEKREPGKADALDHHSQEFGSSSMHFLCASLSLFLTAECSEKHFHEFVEKLSAGINETQSLVKDIRKCTNDLKSIQSRQKILALNANIEAARAGEHGKGFGVVADEVGRLSDSSSAVNEKISAVVKRISEVVNGMSGQELEEQA